MTVKLPVRAHIKNIIIKRDNLDKENPVIDISGNTIFSVIAHSVLCNKQAYISRNGLKRSNRYTETISIKIDKFNVKHNRIFINADSILKFDTVTHGVINEILFERINIYVNQNFDAKEAIISFMRKYELFDHITYEAFKKANYRMRKYRALDHNYRNIKEQNDRR